MSLSTELRIWIVLTVLLLILPLSLLIQSIINKSQEVKKNHNKDEKTQSSTTTQRASEHMVAYVQQEQEKSEQSSSQSATNNTIDHGSIQTQETTSGSIQQDDSATKPDEIKPSTETKKHEHQEQIDLIISEAKRLADRDPSAYEKKLVEGLSLASENSILLTMLTDHYFHTNQHKKSLSLLKKTLEKDSKNHKALWQIGEIYLKQGDIKTAEIMIEKAIKENKDNPKYLYSLVDIKYNTNKIEDAIYLVERIMKLRPTNVEYLTAAAMLYEKKGDTQKAKKCFFEILQYDPENQTAKKMLAHYS